MLEQWIFDWVATRLIDLGLAELNALLVEGLLGCHEHVRARTHRLADRMGKTQEGLLWLVARLPAWLALAEQRPEICQELYCLACAAISVLPSNLPQVRPEPLWALL